VEAFSGRDTLVQAIEAGPSEEDTWRQLIENLKTGDPSRRLTAARELSAFGTVIVPYLVAALDDTTPEHREAILSTLGLLGRRARAAIPAVEKLCEDEQVGPAAREILSRIRRRFHFDRDRCLEIALIAAVIILVSLTVAKEAGEWVEVWSRLQGAGRAIALAWGFLGGVAGYVLGAGLGRHGMAWKGAKALGVLGTAAGAILGRCAGEWLAPLLAALGG
jgi:hypothetical protein